MQSLVLLVLSFSALFVAVPILGQFQYCNANKTHGLCAYALQDLTPPAYLLIFHLVIPVQPCLARLLVNATPARILTALQRALQRNRSLRFRVSLVGPA